MLPKPLKYIIGVLARVDNTSDSKLVTTFLHWESNAVTVFFVNPDSLILCFGDISEAQH